LTAEQKEWDAARARYSDAVVIDTLIPGSPQSYVDNTIKGYEALADESIAAGFNYVSYSAAVDEWIDLTP
jgi:hypothetical protein